jgi:phage portal protein BeeE
LLSSLVNWLSPVYGGALRCEPDLDQVQALSLERDSLWKRVGDADFLTDEEKRTAVGYGAKPG